MSVLRIVAINDNFFSDFDLYNVDDELIPNMESGHNRPYVIVIKLKYKGKKVDFAIPFRSNIAGHREKFEYFALPPRKETKANNVHGLHFIKMFPISKKYFLKYNYPKGNNSADLTKEFINKNFKKLVNKAQEYLIKFEEGYRPKYCVNIDKLYIAISKEAE